MNTKIQLPDFPHLPDKLRKICGELEYQKWQKELEEWRIQMAIATQKWADPLFLQRPFISAPGRAVNSPNGSTVDDVLVVEQSSEHKSYKKALLAEGPLSM